MTQEDKERLKRKNENISRYDLISTNMLLSSIGLYEAADLLIRAYEKRIKASGEDFKYETKKMFNAMTRDIKSLKYHVEQFSELYGSAYEDKAGDYYMHMQNVAYWFAALAVNIGDKVWEVDKMNKILDFIGSLDSNGYIDEETVKSLEPK